MQDSVFLDNRTFQRVWQRVAGSMDAPVTTPPEADTLTDLLAECIRAKAAGAAFYTALSQRIRTGRQQLLGIAAQERAHQRELKPMRQAGDRFCNVLEEILTIIEEYNWLTEKFGNGEYHDIAGLCKIATLDEIAEKNYSLTPGAYVGVPEAEDDGVDFHERMNEIHAELAKLHEEANVLMKEILNDWETLK